MTQVIRVIENSDSPAQPQSAPLAARGPTRTGRRLRDAAGRRGAARLQPAARGLCIRIYGRGVGGGGRRHVGDGPGRAGRRESGHLRQRTPPSARGLGRGS